MNHRLILILIAILSCLPAYSKKEVSVFQNIYAERNVVKNGIRGINIVVSLDASQVMGRKIRIRGLLETGTKPTQYFSSDEVVQVVDMPYFQHLEFFIPSDNLPDGYYTARVNITDITDGTPEYLGHHHVTSFTIDRAKERLQPVIDWSEVPRTISRPQAPVSVGSSTYGRTLTMKVSGREVGRTISPNRINYNPDKWSIGHSPVEVNGETRVIFRERPAMAANAVLSHNFNDNQETFDVDYDLAVYHANGNKIGISLCIEDNYNRINYSDGNSSKFLELGILPDNTTTRFTFSIPWSFIPAEKFNTKLGIALTPFIMINGKWDQLEYHRNSNWSFIPNQLTQRTGPAPSPISKLVNVKNPKVSRSTVYGTDQINIDFDLATTNIGGLTTGISVGFNDGNSMVNLTNGKQFVFKDFGRQTDNTSRQVSISIPWSYIPADKTGSKLNIHFAPYLLKNNNWEQIDYLTGFNWTFIPNQLNDNPNPGPQPVNIGAKPTLTWLSQPEKATSANFTVKVGVNSKSAITDYSVTVNGIKSRGIKSVKNDGYDMVISEPVTLRQGENTIRVEVTNSAGSTTETRTFNFGTAPAPAVTKNLPLLTWISAPTSTQENNVTIKVGVKSQSAISDYKVWVNGAQARGIKAVKNDGYDLLIEQPVTLQQGDNTVRVDVTNADGITSESRTVNYIVKSVPVVIEQSLKKIALVVGNANYSGQELKNTVNDATAISSTLKALGFDVISVTDVNRRQLDGAINDFGSKARNYDVAMFYYAGHGIQYKGDNYLVPVNANLQSESDVEYECTNVNRILSKLEESGCKMKIIVLDACRNNPFERAWHRGAGNGRGLSVINAPIGTLISYATSPGTTASDGDGDHSPYTQAFLEVLAKKDLPIESVFKKVAAQVVNSTNRTQTPWYASSLFEGEFIFNPSK